MLQAKTQTDALRIVKEQFISKSVTNVSPFDKWICVKVISFKNLMDWVFYKLSWEQCYPKFYWNENKHNVTQELKNTYTVSNISVERNMFVKIQTKILYMEAFFCF